MYIILIVFFLLYILIDLTCINKNEVQVLYQFDP